MGRLLLSPPDVGERERSALLAAFDSGWVAPAGPDLAAFEQDVAARVGVQHAVALSSGTAGLHLALIAAGVGPGDRVWVPSFTFVATANAVAYTGAEPVFVDCDAETWCLDVDLVAAALVVARDSGQLPAAVIAVDLFGQCADYDRLRDLCQEYGIFLLEDAAESLGSTYRGRQAGALGDAAVLSFNGNKIITTSGGGMLLCDRGEVADRVRHLATQARAPVVHYEHEDVGFNYRWSNLLAALGRAQLSTLDAKVASRRRTYQHYASRFSAVPEIEMMPSADYGESNCWLTCVLLDVEELGLCPDEVCRRLDALDIEARPLWKPMHLQPVYSHASRLGGRVCEDLFSRGLCLPSGSAMTTDDVDRVADALLETLATARKAAV